MAPAMKKPLLLLVDDDRAVIEALEAELRPAFEDICRIESFDDPREALASLPRWTEEQRSIAVAIVDQKMPGMSGVEFLVALREAAIHAAEGTFHPAACTRAILLTGYAGLDSALAAKNEAAVDRYFEKPWRARQLRSAITRAFVRHLQESSSGRHYVLREVKECGGVRSVLRLRFDVYVSTPGMVHLLPASRVGMDADEYDPYSHFLALYAHDVVEDTMVGTMRVTDPHHDLSRSPVEEALAGLPALLERVHQPRPFPIPMLKYLPDRDVVLDLCESLARGGEGFMEPGRFVINPAYRSHAPGAGHHLARVMIDGTVAFFFSCGVEHAFLACVPSHAVLYRPYGFRETEGTRTQHFEAWQTDGTCLHGRIAWVPSPARERCEALAARIARTGAACRCATFPACLGGPYESGEFRDVDLFCPVRAGEVVGTPAPAST